MGQPRAEQALRALELLVGEWAVEAKGPDGQAWPGEGRASFRWHPSHAAGASRRRITSAGRPVAFWAIHAAAGQIRTGGDVRSGVVMFIPVRGGRRSSSAAAVRFDPPLASSSAGPTMPETP